MVVTEGVAPPAPRLSSACSAAELRDDGGSARTCTPTGFTRTLFSRQGHYYSATEP